MAARHAKALKEIESALSREGAAVLAVEADVTKPEDHEKIRKEAEKKFGRIDTWVNNAGTSIYGPLLAVPLEDEKKLFETNFWGIRHGSHVAVDAMREKGGVIINLGSEVSGRAVPVQGMYSATKHAVKAFTDALRMELEHEGVPIQVSLIRPTAINTPFPEHAKNLLEKGEPALPSPTYHPNVVAEAILECAEHPQRDVYVGGGSRLFDLLDAFLPRAVDRLMESFLFKQQIQGTNVPHEKKQEALHQPPEREGDVLGTAKGKMRTSSAYTSLAQHALRALAIAGAAVAIGGAISMALKEKSAA
jgi:short-subunit dehydrogenase